MSIYDYRTIVPAKTKIHWEPKTTPKPEISMAEDAKACNAKMRRHFFGIGASDKPGQGQDNNAQRMKQARARDEALVPLVMDYIAKHGPTSCAKMSEALGVSVDILRRVHDVMTKAGIDCEKDKGGRPGRDCYYRGKWYPSATAAAADHGVSVTAVTKANNKRRLE